MRHTLRKYLSNRGSALFMVLSTMTALLISCTAMYFSVVSSRSTQYAIFYQQQSYQSATSLADAVMASIVSGSGGFEDIGKKLFAESFKVGDKITTGSNGYKAFAADGSGNEEDDQVGAYMLEAVRLPDETRADGKTQRMFDIIITTSVNGKKEVYHNIFSAQELTQNIISGPNRIFAATGYAPNDVFVEHMSVASDLYFDAEYTVIEAYTNSGVRLEGNLITGGSLTINEDVLLEPKGKTEFLIRDTFTNYGGTPITFKATTAVTEVEKNKTRSNVLIGGDCHFMDNGSGFKNANVYILGDLYVNKSGTIDTSCKYFVDGDVIFRDNNNISNIYCNGSIIKDKAGITLNGTAPGKWADGATGKAGNGLMTVQEMIEYLDYETSSSPQYNWDVKTDGLYEETLKFNTTDHPYPTYVLSYDDPKYKTQIDGEDVVGCIIKDSVMNIGNGYNFTLVIDTGEDPENIFTIGLQANRVMAGDTSGEKTVFCWYPRDLTTGAAGWKQTGNSQNFQVLVMGRGSVVIDVPKGVTYQDDDRFQFKHYGWFVMSGGQEEFVGTAGGSYTKKARIQNTKYLYRQPTGNDSAFFSQFVHTSCYEGDGCTYEEFESLEDCPYECGGKLIDVTCAHHGTIDSYCPACEPLRADHHGKCANRKDTKAIDNFLNKPENAAIKTKLKDSTGKVIYPTTNIFLVSTDENADMRFSFKANANPLADPYSDPIIQNEFFGFVYAPYLTYKAAGDNSGGGMVKMVGGMTVSDYVLETSQAIIACYPDKMPLDLMDEDSKNNPLNSISNKSWKINLKAH